MSRLIFFLTSLFLACVNFILVSLLLQNRNPIHFVRETPDFSVKKDFTSLSKRLGKQESMVSATYTKNGNIKIELRGFQTFDSNQLNKVFQNDLHSTEELGLYSLNVISQILKNEEFNVFNNCSSLKPVIKIVDETLHEIDNFSIVPNQMKYNDHVVSVRLESILLLKAKIEEMSCDFSQINNQINRHIETSILEFLDPKKFTWRTNHGLMQLRALLAFEYSLHENKYTEQVRSRIDEILSNNTLLDFHIASDGSVFEAATGYWYFIFNQWKIIASYPYLKDYDELQSRVLKIQKFLKYTATNNGFSQGVGDSYNIHSEDNSHKKRDNYVFKYQNGLAGFNLTDTTGNNISLLFVSLDNKPHVKKKPEDLAVYLYYNEPFFANSGIFAWDNSPERNQVKSQAVQNTVYNRKFFKPDSSVIKKVGFSNKNIILHGQKWYGKNEIQRKVIYNKEKGIQISDYPFDSNSIVSGFNIYPGIEVNKKDENLHKIFLSGNQVKLELSSNVIPRLVKATISDEVNSMIEIDRIIFEGQVDTLKILIKPNHLGESTITPIVINNGTKSNQRLEAANILSNEYWLSEKFYIPSLKRLLIPRVILTIFIFFIVKFLPKKMINPTLIILAVFYFMDILSYGMLLSITFLK